MKSIDDLLERLAPHIGVERALDRAGFDLKSAVREMRAQVVGVHHITCSDEAEFEDVEVFQRIVAKDLAPRLKLGVQGLFRTAALGSRYEWGSLRAAEGNFCTPLQRDGFKLMLVKVSAHVGCLEEHGARTFGQFVRYGQSTPTCKALHAFADGIRAPFADELHSLFTSEGKDRLALLAEVDPTYRSLAMTAVAARLQARSAVLEAQDHEPLGPTVYLIVPAVTLNKPGRDTEITVGAYVIDRRGKPRDLYRGLGDDPRHYRFSDVHQHIHVRDDTANETRPARDHRALARDRLEEMGGATFTTDARVEALLREAEHPHAADAHVAKRIALGLLPLLAEATPVGAALALFGGGATGIYEAYRAHHVMQDVRNSAPAREMLGDLSERLERLPPDEARKVVEVLLAARKRRG